MSSFKDSQASRPQSSHPFPMNGSTPPSTMPIRHAASRHHSHSVSLGAVNPTHRVTRRKSLNASGVNKDGVAAALNEDAAVSTNRRSWNTKIGRVGEGSRDPASIGSRHSQESGVRSNSNPKIEAVHDDSAISDDLLSVEQVNNATKPKPRRASEGSYLSRGETKRSSGELRCETCGKGYKHSSCLTKHLWEHTPEWSYTSKLLISKHQQVQLLEAASVLVGMNQDPSLEQEASTSDFNSSASPAASGSSDIRDDEEGYSSAETSPPPVSENASNFPGMESVRSKRHSGNSSSFSRSYQSAPASSVPAGSVLSQYPFHQRPSTSGLAASADEEEAGLAAAVASLCSFGTPQNRPVLLPADIPPVPPLPAQYAEQNANRLSTNLEPASGRKFSPSSFQAEQDVDMDNTHQYHKENYDYDESYVHENRSDEDDEGVFTMDGMTGHEHQG